MQYDFMYTSSLSLFLIATSVLFVCNLKNWRPNFLNFLSACYILNIISLIVDILWSLVDGKPEYVFWNHIFTIIEHHCYSFTGYCWLMYCCCHSQNSKMIQYMKSGKYILAIPAVMVSLLMISSFSTGLIYTIDDHFHYQRGPWFFLRQIGGVYLIAASVLTLIYRSKTDLPSVRTHYLIVSSFCVPPVILGTVQMFLPFGTIACTQFSIFLSLFIIYVEDQDQKITRDSLTKLRNRYEFERVVKDRMAHYKHSSCNHLYLLGGDLNHFKAINDTFGHQTGDHALKITADTLETLAHEYGAVVARISGDEFSVLMEAASDDIPAQFCQEASVCLNRACANEKFDLSISIGIARYDGSMSITELFNRADQQMYQVKKKSGHLDR